ncbi:PREDICTED: probable receptor-like serine/threonine-protein kinase At5g57670 [Nicotiana attenuata]|uniref:Receptor-like serinethreonine-protein kinase n=1 Tax=Nicotiana attenuata TaxID=49451 RepID=A0A1J6HVA8_NICAT|nr:PREDICTED: probable receptor-like serine/threonine-protein kinase At5g57670 [Nicotiana attenuata]OIS96757.1 putative receptor-like serinethreonine-protein kinase [Nicotiana attenuata]
MRYVRTSSLKRLFSFGRHSFDGDFPKGCEENNTTSTATDAASPTTQPPHRPTWKCFSFQEIFRATNGFNSENIVGRGGYAEVYKGVLDDGQAIAVKMLTKATDDERKEKEFLTEIGTLGHVCHPNVTSLLGCCIENGLYLIFQFSSKGSVASILHDEKSATMDWETRYKIALGTAKGLYYLHKSCPRRIIHRDIKASNVLLSEEYEPQISDFGLAKWLPSQWTHHSIVPIEGTFGHLAPEYFMHGVVDEKTDVFAFGVFCLELISGKKPVDNSHQSLHSWAKPLLSRGVIEEVVDPRLEGRFDSTQLHKLAFAASLCIRASSIWRPTMNEILEIILGGEVDKDKWKMPDEEEEEQEEFWGFEDLECECECDSSFSTSPHDTF